MDKPKVPGQSRAVLSTTAGQDLTRQMLSGKPLTDEAKKTLAQLRPNQGPAKEINPLLRAWFSPEELELILSEPRKEEQLSAVAPPIDEDQATSGTQYWFWCSYLDNPR